MADVTVKATHAVMDLADGEIATIERTELVDRLIEQERLIVVPDAVLPEHFDGGLLPNDPDVPTDQKEHLRVPHRNASLGVWEAFLKAVELPVPEGAGRDDLLDFWDIHKDEVDLTVVRQDADDSQD